MSSTGVDVVENARRFATLAHAGQFRKYNGQPYHVHTRRVGKRALQLEFPPYAAAAAHAHDVLEDCKHVSYDHLADAIGSAAVELVRCLTNPSKRFPKMCRVEKKKMDREHIANQSMLARCIKLIDRVDNITDMALAPVADQRRYALESRLLLNALIGTHSFLERELHESLRVVERRVGIEAIVPFQHYHVTVNLWNRR